MKSNEHSRREFIKKGSMTGLGAMLGLSMVSSSLQAGNLTSGAIIAPEGNILSIHPRYHRWHVDLGVEWLETNTEHATLDWSIPVSQTALVLVDVWQRHYIKEPEERAGVIIDNKLLPLLDACRKEGLSIIHAPSLPVAKQHPNWVNLLSEEDKVSKRDSWPPAQFLNKSGSYQSYRRPIEPREAERQQLPPLDFHPKVQPLAGEAVIGTGEELHRYCKQNGILFLLFAGFNTNACILSRDYGTLEMSKRGYEIVLVRDCTTGMESKETQPTLSQTTGATLLLEMFGQYSIASDEIISGFSKLG